MNRACTMLLPIAAILLLPGCAGLQAPPSLAPRPGEVQARAAAPAAPLPPADDTAVLGRIDALVALARRGDALFAEADRAGALAITMGRKAAVGSDAWIAGETARSALEAARQASAQALADIDREVVAAAEAAGTDATTGNTALTAAQTGVAAMVARQSARLDELSR